MAAKPPSKPTTPAPSRRSSAPAPRAPAGRKSVPEAATQLMDAQEAARVARQRVPVDDEGEATSLSTPEMVSQVRRAVAAAVEAEAMDENAATVLGVPEFIAEVRNQLARDARHAPEDDGGDAFEPESGQRPIPTLDDDDDLRAVDPGDVADDDPIDDPVIAALRAADEPPLMGDTGGPTDRIKARADDVFGDPDPSPVPSRPSANEANSTVMVEVPRIPPSSRGAPARGPDPDSGIPATVTSSGVRAIPVPARPAISRSVVPARKAQIAAEGADPTGTTQEEANALPEVLVPGPVKPPVRTHRIGVGDGKLLLSVPEGSRVAVERAPLGQGTVLLVGLDGDARLAVEVSFNGYETWRSMVSLGGRSTGQVKVELRRARRG